MGVSDQSGFFCYHGVYLLSLSRRWLTLALDIIGQRFIGSTRLSNADFVADDGTVFPNIAFANDVSIDTLGGAAGVKVAAGNNLLVDFNVLFKLDDDGLRDRMTPLLGVEYSF